jgi:hypothetical protein
MRLHDAMPPAPEPRRIDYDKANRLFRKQKAALTRATNSGNPRRVVRACARAIEEWGREDIPWPDSWATWKIALTDALYELRFEDFDPEDPDDVEILEAAAMARQEGWL